MPLDKFTLKIINQVFDAKEKAENILRLEKILRESPAMAEVELMPFYNYFYDKIIDISDWYFHFNFGCDHPKEGDFGGIVSYAFYDAGCVHAKNEIYDLKNKDRFKDYILTLQKTTSRSKTND